MSDPRVWLAILVLACCFLGLPALLVIDILKHPNRPNPFFETVNEQWAWENGVLVSHTVNGKEATND